MVHHHNLLISQKQPIEFRAMVCHLDIQVSLAVDGFRNVHIGGSVKPDPRHKSIGKWLEIGKAEVVSPMMEIAGFLFIIQN